METQITLDDIVALPHTCKVYNKLEHAYLNFEYEYTKSDEIIGELEDNDVDVSQYQTEESKKKEEQQEAQWMIDCEEHLKNCSDNHCVITYKYRKQQGTY